MPEVSIAAWERLLVQFLQSLPEPAMITDRQGSIEFVNNPMLLLVGLTEDQTVGQPFPYPWLLPKEQLDRLPWVNQGRQFEGTAQVESVVTDTKGNHRIIKFSITALDGPEDRARQLLSVGRDVTPQHPTGEILEIPESERLESGSTRVISGSPPWVQLCRLDGTIETVNDAACSISGYDRSQMVGRSWPYPWLIDGWSEIFEDPFVELSRSGQTMEFETSCRTQQGDSKELSVTLMLFGEEDFGRALMVAQVISEREHEYEQLIQAEKLRAVTQLASGVAHDINNDLAVILGYSEYLLNGASSLEVSQRQAVDAIQQQAQECAETVRRIQMFSLNTSSSKFTFCSINDIVRRVVEATECLEERESREIGKEIKFETDLQGITAVLAHLDSLEEVLTSLVRNAVAALPEAGTVRISTRSEDGIVVLEVTDDGAGVDPGHMNRIFEPFFTTKGAGSSGLGLSIAYNLVNQMSGSISVESTQGTGTTVFVCFPATCQPSECMETIDTMPTKGGLDVMVVDDEPLVAGMLGTFLESLGHRASVFLDGAEAVQAFEGSQIDLALIDLGLPGMDGWEVARRIHEFGPETPIIVATGWNITVEDGLEQGASVNVVLRKPFAMSDLAAAIEDATKSGRRWGDGGIKKFRSCS